MKLLMNTTSPYTRIARIALWEKGFHDIETQIVDPWGDTLELIAANPAARVPTLLTDDGQVLTECLLIVLWLEKTKPSPSLFASDVSSDLARVGVAMGVIDAAVHTLIGRRIVDGPSFDSSPVGLRRRRTMVEGLKRIEASGVAPGNDTPSFAAITAIVALDYIHFRFPGAQWIPPLEKLDRLRDQMRTRPSIEQTVPHG